MPSTVALSAACLLTVHGLQLALGSERRFSAALLLLLGRRKAGRLLSTLELEVLFLHGIKIVARQVSQRASLLVLVLVLVLPVLVLLYSFCVWTMSSCVCFR